MRSFGLTPDQVMKRVPWNQLSLPPLRRTGLIQGALSFGLVSLGAYSLWAYRLIPHEGALFAAIALVYVGVGGVALGRLVRGGDFRFPLLFAAGFAAYAALWCAGWFSLGGKHHGDLYGSAAGLAVLTILLRQAFGARGGWIKSFGVLFACHTLGYTLGADAHDVFGGVEGRLAWGVCHGAGFGAGLGYVLADAQAGLRRRLTGS
jgi:hypothetical protein